MNTRASPILRVGDGVGDDIQNREISAIITLISMLTRAGRTLRICSSEESKLWNEEGSCSLTHKDHEKLQHQQHSLEQSSRCP